VNLGEAEEMIVAAVDRHSLREGKHRKSANATPMAASSSRSAPSSSRCRGPVVRGAGNRLHRQRRRSLVFFNEQT
jgi:hypothetical protein